ncbi:hypothetical protein [Emcibacter sp.]|uniref:hypothetical protein n=1 Tax=Emcibacter sp. TaxID=1979954 RepID=UPI003A955649
MTAYELTELTINAMNRLDASWALFLSVHAALFGGIVYIDRPLKRTEKAVLIMAYGTVAFYNYYLIRISQKLLSGLYQDLAEIQEIQKLELHTLEFFNQFSQSAWGWASHAFTITVHMIALVVVVSAIILDGTLKQNKT